MIATLHCGCEQYSEAFLASGGRSGASRISRQGTLAAVLQRSTPSGWVPAANGDTVSPGETVRIRVSGLYSSAHVRAFWAATGSTIAEGDAAYNPLNGEAYYPFAVPQAIPAGIPPFIQVIVEGAQNFLQGVTGGTKIGVQFKVSQYAPPPVDDIPATGIVYQVTQGVEQIGTSTGKAIGGAIAGVGEGAGSAVKDVLSPIGAELKGLLLPALLIVGGVLIFSSIKTPYGSIGRG